jgi:hypothetical protein
MNRIVFAVISIFIFCGTARAAEVTGAVFTWKKEFHGYRKTPPRADEIKEHVLNLAEFEIKPKLF